MAPVAGMIPVSVPRSIKHVSAGFQHPEDSEVALMQGDDNEK